MLILAFDTTAAACSVALWRDGTVVHKARQVMAQGQAEALVPMIEEVMAAAKVAYADLDRIAVTVGPGSFTGVRVGLSAARGIALAADKPVVGVTSMEALAAAVPAQDKIIVVAIDTKRSDLFVQQFAADGKSLGDIAALAPEKLAGWIKDPCVIIGDGASIAAAAIIGATVATADSLPDPAFIARIAATRTPQAGGPLPLYVHAPAVTVAS